MQDTGSLGLVHWDDPEGSGEKNPQRWKTSENKLQSIISNTE